MVILGGLELVAAGYVINELSKDGKQKRSNSDDKRRHSHKHHHQKESPPRRPRPQQYLSLPQGVPPRAQSAPPPGGPGAWRPMPGAFPQSQPQAHQTWQAPVQHGPPIAAQHSGWQPSPLVHRPTGEAMDYYNNHPAAQAQQRPFPQQPRAMSRERKRSDANARFDSAYPPSIRTPRYSAQQTASQTNHVGMPDPRYAELSGDAFSSRQSFERQRPYATSVASTEYEPVGHSQSPPPPYHI